MPNNLLRLTMKNGRSLLVPSGSCVIEQGGDTGAVVYVGDKTFDVIESVKQIETRANTKSPDGF